MRRGRRVDYNGDLKQTRRLEEMRRRLGGREDPSKRVGEMRRGVE